MKHRIIIIIAVAILGIIFWKMDMFKDPRVFGVCKEIDDLCESNWFYGVIVPLYKSLPYLISSLALLVFFPYSFLKIWMKIMIPYSIIAFIIVSLTAPLCGGMVCFDRTLVASGLSKIFLILTILILLTKSIYLFFKNRKNKGYKI
jgi:hypothetical protein